MRRSVARGYVATVDVLTSVSGVLSAAAVVALLLVVTSDAVARHLGGGSIKGGLEIAEVLLVVAVFLGLAPAQRAGFNVATTMVVDRAPKRLAGFMRGAGLVLSALFAAWLFWASYGEAVESVQVRESLYGLTRIPLWPARLAVAIGSLLLLAQIAATALRPPAEPDGEHAHA